MDPNIKGLLYTVGGRFWDYAFNRLTTRGGNPVENRIAHIDKVIESLPADTEELTQVPATAPQVANEPPESEKPPNSYPATTAPTTEETTGHLKKRMGIFLSQLEDDLVDGARIAGKPCDCLEKHSGKIAALAMELSSMDRNPVYSEIIAWFEAHEEPFKFTNVAKNPPEFYRSLAPEVRRFRKEVTGSEAPIRQGGDQQNEDIRRRAEAIRTKFGKQNQSEMTLDEAKRMAAEQAEKEIETRWQSQEKK